MSIEPCVIGNEVMTHIVAEHTSASHREESASPCVGPMRVPASTQASASRVRDLAAEAARSVCGNARAAAIDVNVHEAHFSRLMKDGTLRVEQLEQLGPKVALKFGQLLVEHFGTAMESPDARIHRLARQLRAIADEIDQAAEFKR